MLPAPSEALTVRVNPWVMPGCPAVPKNNAYNDHNSAAVVPTEMRVSMVAAPWRRLSNAAR